ncbi:KRAB-A domain-containing protein 2-like [Rhopalosiphum padi]|uniref:KRAB-A domain-containing protein 2-like n=1 Tax=Rhopalosiphum padi TaxID=40932 RepID=UPI00298D98C7|nr:KRAB-A domain-containing protein 2-like [Rhopalosiphum padi]
MNYQDHATKYLYLRPLTSKRATEVAHELLKNFLEQGAPQILQSDNGREFTAKIIEELAELWPECKIVHGRPQHPQSQGSVERSNQDVENMLRAWVVDNKSTKWSIGVYFVQWQKNISHHRILGRLPIEPCLALNRRNFKEVSYNKLLDNLHMLDLPGSLDSLKKKIKSLRDTYRKELQKVQKSKKSGAGANDVYKPKLAWFSSAEVFWKRSIIGRESFSNLNVEEI